MAYDRKLESVVGAKAKYDEHQKSASRERLKKIASQVKAKKAKKKEAQA
jgi:hypothetical protein